MRKEAALLLVCVSAMLIVSMPMVSAGFFSDFWDNVKDIFSERTEITGRAQGPDTCTDNDGNDKYTRSSCYSSNDDGTDSCVSSTTVREYTCTDEPEVTCVSNDLYCGSGYECQAGACSQQPCTGNLHAYCFNTHQHSLVCDRDPVCQWMEPEGCGIEPGVSCDDFSDDGSACIAHDCTWNGGGFCGDGSIGGGEVCDGLNLDGETCVSQGFISGILSCSADCLSFDTSRCSSVTCTDSDGGDDPYIAGACQVTGQATQSDFCLPQDNIHQEYFCSGNSCASNVYSIGEEIPSSYKCGDGKVILKCGDGVLDSGEQCDDGGNAPGDGCSATCTNEASCGDGSVNQPGEQCDDGDNEPEDGCSATCTLENGECYDNENPDNMCEQFHNNQPACVDPSIGNCNWRYLTCTDSDGDGYSVEGGLCGAIDCNDNSDSVHPGISEVCGDGIDNDCTGGDLDCAAVCTDSDGDGYGVPASNACRYFSEDCNNNNENINPGKSEVCGNDVDENCNDLVDEGCVYYNIEELRYYHSDVYENAEIPIACKYKITNTAGEKLLDPINTSESCIMASVGGNFGHCNFVLDSQGADGSYFRTFECDVGSEFANQEIQCAVNTGVCPAGNAPSSEPGELNVTKPLSCPQDATGGQVTADIGEDYDFSTDTFEANQSFNLDVTVNNALALESIDLFYEAQLYNLNTREKLFETIESKTLTNEDNLFLELRLPSLVSEEGKYRLYVKIHTEDENEVCIIREHDLMILASGEIVLDFDFREASIKRVQAVLGEVKKFTINGLVEHEFKVASISDTSATITISSDPQNVTLDIGESTTVDLEGDGIDDLNITLLSITNGTANVDITSLESFTTCQTGSVEACGTGGAGTRFCIGGSWTECSYNEAEGSDEEIGEGSFEDTGLDSGSQEGTSSDSLAPGIDLPFYWYIVIGIIVLLIFILILVVILRRKMSKPKPPVAAPPMPIQPKPPVQPPMPSRRPRPGMPVRK